MKENKIIERLRVHLEEVKKYYPEKILLVFFFLEVRIMEQILKLQILILNA